MKPAIPPSPQTPVVKTPSAVSAATPVATVTAAPREIGGRRKGLEPTRYGDWEKNGRCIDF